MQRQREMAHLLCVPPMAKMIRNHSMDANAQYIRRWKKSLPHLPIEFDIFHDLRDNSKLPFFGIFRMISHRTHHSSQQQSEKIRKTVQVIANGIFISSIFHTPSIRHWVDNVQSQYYENPVNFDSLLLKQYEQQQEFIGSVPMLDESLAGFALSTLEYFGVLGWFVLKKTNIYETK